MNHGTPGAAQPQSKSFDKIMDDKIIFNSRKPSEVHDFVANYFVKNIPCSVAVKEELVR